jgi:hypothetical protein
MATFLFHVLELFDIPDRGVVVATDRAIRDCDFRLKIGDEIEIRHESRPVFRTKLAGIEMCDPYSPSRPFAFLLPISVGKQDIPVGAQIWQLDTDRNQETKE